jgi:ArsR family transcriptional regulator, virulence genes transcriptional regulator
MNALKAELGAAEALMKALSSRPRLALLCEMLEGERTVTELHEAVGLSMSAVSQHLAKLRQAKVVATRRDAQVISYSLASEAARRILRTLYDAYCASPRTTAVAKKKVRQA